MDTFITAPTEEENQTVAYWALWYQEVPRCSEPGCQKVAVEVDTFFPYMDDNNRCWTHRHPDEEMLNSLSRLIG